VQGTLVDAMHPESAEIALPQFDAVGLARRAALPAAVVIAGVATLILVQGKLGVIADAFHRALDADWRWVAAGAAFELLSFAGYVALMWLVAGRATPRIDLRRAVEVTLGGAAATRLLPTAGVGGAALTLWTFRRAGMNKRASMRTLLTFLVVLYAVFLGAIVVSGAVTAAGGEGPLTLSAIPAAIAATGFAVVLVLGLWRRRVGANGTTDADRDPAALERLGTPVIDADNPRAGRVRRGALILGDATADAIGLLRTRDPRLLGALAWWTFDAAVLWAMLSAFGAANAIAVVALAYFVGQVGNALPIPGAVSGGMVGVLLAFGVQADLAVVAVLAYRAIAIWLPAPIGLLALASLRRTIARWSREQAGETVVDGQRADRRPLGRPRVAA
jgi:putative heme transporter